VSVSVDGSGVTSNLDDTRARLAGLVDDRSGARRVKKAWQTFSGLSVVSLKEPDGRADY
jgi:hypothetical protein